MVAKKIEKIIPGKVIVALLIKNEPIFD